jgi:hypothetical protein
MKTAALLAKVAAVPGWLSVAQFSSRTSERLGFAVAALLTVAGMVLSWHLPRQRMSVEEGIKDGKLTEAQARFRLRLYHVGAPATTIAGMVLLVKWFMMFAE